MRAKDYKVNNVVNSEAIQALSPYFPWIERFEIQVSAGMFNVVAELLTQIESIFGSKPSLTFFRIVEESFNNEIYQRQLFVFYTSRTRDHAKIEALHQTIKHANALSKTVCYRCGQALVTKNVQDENSLRVYPYLALVDTDDDYRRTHSVCMTCCEHDWQQSQTNIERSPTSDDLKEFSTTEKTTKVNESNSDATTPSVITIYELGDVDKLEQDYQSGPKDQVYRVKAIIKKIRQGSPHKRLVSIPDNWRNFCDELERDFPNFKEVVNFFRNQLALSSVGDGVLRSQPCLLVGGAGIGKSEFMLTAASALQTRLEIINVSNAQTGAVLTGSETYWSNAMPGGLYQILVNGEIANPLLMLDELDKASSGNYKPLAALHQLLEPRQARGFSDLCVPELKFDASHVLWIATANDIQSIEKPIVDRFCVFNIADPTHKQMKIIVKNQYVKFIDSHPSGKYFELKPSDEVLEELSFYHPRKVRKILEQAFGAAAYAQRSFLTVPDIRKSDMTEKEDCSKRGIGFMATI